VTKNETFLSTTSESSFDQRCDGANKNGTRSYFDELLCDLIGELLAGTRPTSSTTALRSPVRYTGVSDHGHRSASMKRQPAAQLQRWL